MKPAEIFLLFLLYVFYSCQSKSPLKEEEAYKLIINLENAPFDSLYLQHYTNDGVLYNGEKTDQFTWEFTLPDSVIYDYEFMRLLVSPFDSTTNSSKAVRFITEINGKNNAFQNVGIDDSVNYVKGVYIKESIFPRDPITLKIGDKDSVITGNTVVEDFKLIIEDEHADIAVRAQDPFFSWFMNFDGENKSYDELLAFYVQLSKKHPDSRYLLDNLALNLGNYRSKSDVLAVYENLSDKHKNTYLAKRIERFLSGKFQNAALPTFDKNLQNIIQDTSKYNLLVFSASWCGPCIEEIPLLKKIHQDLGDKLIFTYISMDKEDGMLAFDRILKENDIIWRSLYAYQDLAKIRQKYFVPAIPWNILIAPNGDMEGFDVRNEEFQAKLYSKF
jgi:thiol-disulfide isomerase/thioredoxin